MSLKEFEFSHTQTICATCSFSPFEEGSLSPSPSSSSIRVWYLLIMFVFCTKVHAPCGILAVQIKQSVTREDASSRPMKPVRRKYRLLYSIMDCLLLSDYVPLQSMKLNYILSHNMLLFEFLCVYH